MFSGLSRETIATGGMFVCRSGGFQTPRAGMAISACGVGHPRTRKLNRRLRRLKVEHKKAAGGNLCGF